MTDVAVEAPSQRAISAYIRANGLMAYPTDSTIRVAAIFVGWVGLFFLARFVDNLAFWVATWIAQGFLFEGMSGAAHEAGHGKLYKARLANSMAGWLVSIPRVVSFPAYKAAHLEHHRHTHDPAADSEPHYNQMGLIDYILYMGFSGTTYTLILNYQGLLASLGVGPRWYTSVRQRKAAAWGTLLVLVELGGVAVGAAFDPRLLVALWLVPFLLYNSVIASLATKPEHYGCGDGPDDSFHTTRTTYSNPLFARLLWHNNLHTAHHQFPSVPGNNLPQLQGFIDPYCLHKSRSYTRWHWQTFVEGLKHPGAMSVGTIDLWIAFRNRQRNSKRLVFKDRAQPAA